MRNINELIGIIKGINFDGVINDKEIIRLQSWINKNRNLSYEDKQVELINLIDNILEDHVIDDSEKQRLINSAEDFLNEQGDDIGKIYELNGIIEGIICDGEINEAEVYRLKEWMDNNGESVRNHKLSLEICNLINSILEDGIVTEEKQKRLLNILTTRIKNSQFEIKLNYLCKQVKARKNIGIDLIDILDNESAMIEIHKRAEKQLINALTSYSGYCSNKEIIVVSLALIAMLEYDGNYYDSVRATYKNVYDKFKKEKVEGLIRSILARYKKQNDFFGRTRIINVALENAIVPQAFLAAFFEFIFDIYKLNFEYDLPNEPYEDFEFVFEGLRNNMLSDGDNISVNVTQKTYKLIAATKQLITREDGLDAIIKLSIIIVKLIDRRYWNKEVIIDNPYLKVGYEGWEKQLKDKSRGNNERHINSADFRSRWEPKIVMANNSIYLLPPAHRVKAQYDYRNIEVVVLNDGIEIYRESNCFIKEIIGGYQVKPSKIQVECPLGKLVYRLVAGDDVIYDSKEKLYRNFLVFNQNGQEVSNNTDFEGVVYICYRREDIDLEDVIKREFYCIGCKIIKQGDAIGIGHDVFNFSSMVKPGIFGKLHKNCYVSSLVNDDCIPVYKEVNVLTFEAEKSISKFEIIINGKPHKLSDMQYKITARDAIIKYVVDLDIKKNGIYEIKVNQIVSGKRVHILSDRFVLDYELMYSFEPIDENQYRIKVNTGILKDNISTEITIYDFDPKFIIFEYNEKKYSYLLPFDFGFYSIDEKKWNTVDEELWIDDISIDSVLRVYDSECDGLLVYNGDGKLLEDNIVVQDKGYYKKVLIGFLNSYKSNHNRVMLVFTVSGKKKHILFCYNKCVIDEDATEIMLYDNPKSVIISPVFHGKNRIFFEIFNKNGEKVYTSKALNSGQSETIEEFNSFEEYTFNFHEKTKILMLRKNTLLYQTTKTFYAKQDFVGRVFKINTAYYSSFVGKKYKEREYYFNKAFIRIIDVIDDKNLKGQIIVKTLKGEWCLDQINPVEVEICSEIIDDMLDVYITNCGDGLLLDLEKHGILNSLEHPTAPDIVWYTLSIKGELTDEKEESYRKI